MFNQIGYVQSSNTQKTDYNWEKTFSSIIINEDLEEGLFRLIDFSHIIVIYHLNEAYFESEKHLIRRPQGRIEMPHVVFLRREQRIVPTQSASHLPS